MKPKDDIGARTMLRLYLEFTRTEKAMILTGERPEYMSDVVRNPNVVAAIGDLLAVAREMSKKIGNEREVAAYLLKHEEEDTEWLGENFTSSSFIEEIKEALMSGPPCPQCGETMCLACKGCHACDKPKEQVN